MSPRKKGGRPTSEVSAADLSAYLRLILTARVYDVVSESPLTPAQALGDRLRNQLLIKREDMQPIHSFKLRGAYNKMIHLPSESLARGVITASAGNHGQGVAYSARHLGTRALVVMPTTTPLLKINAVKAFGAEVLLRGESYTEAYQYSLNLGKDEGLSFVHPFDDPLVIAGQGTIAPEIIRQSQHSGSPPISAVFVAVGGGGLAAGVAAYVKAVHPEIRVIGVQASDSTAMIQSIKSGQLVQLETVGLFCDATAVKVPGRETLRLCSALVDEFITVTSDSISAAIKDVFTDTRVIAEPAGALAVAAVKKYVAQHGCVGETFAAVLCGSNVNFDRLRYIAARAAVGEEAEALFAVSLPEHPGSLRRFLESVNPLTDTTRQITELSYRSSSSPRARLLLGISSNFPRESETLSREMSSIGYPNLDLTRDEVAQEHIRHLLGNIASPHPSERLFRFLFPERPGALFYFLTHLPPEWSITLLHYRNQGADYGSVLVGLDTRSASEESLSRFVSSVGYECTEVTHHLGCHFFGDNDPS